MYSIVSYFKVEGKRPIVHAWGPYATRKEALSAVGKAKRRHAKQVAEGWSRPDGELTFHTCEILGRVEEWTVDREADKAYEVSMLEHLLAQAHIDHAEEVMQP